MFSSRRRAPATTTTRSSPSTARGGLLSRLTGGPKTRSHTAAARRSHATTARHGYAAQSHAQPVHHHKRKPSIGDKVSGALLKIKGSLTGKPGVKAAGTKRMRGTDGRGARNTAATGRRRGARRTAKTRY